MISRKADRGNQSKPLKVKTHTRPGRHFHGSFTTACLGHALTPAPLRKHPSSLFEPPRPCSYFPTFLSTIQRPNSYHNKPPDIPSLYHFSLKINTLPLQNRCLNQRPSSKHQCQRTSPATLTKSSLSNLYVAHSPLSHLNRNYRLTSPPQSTSKHSMDSATRPAMMTVEEPKVSMRGGGCIGDCIDAIVCFECCKGCCECCC